jgi:tetratricopeptide (TPR) repeat protein
MLCTALQNKRSAIMRKQFQQFMAMVSIGGMLLLLGACTTPQQASLNDHSIWQDQAFAYQPTLVTETRDSVFALEPAVVQSLLSADKRGQPLDLRLHALVSRLYNTQGLRLAYARGGTTVAADTWQNQQGDCLSLTILGYAMARALHLNAYMQEVQVPITFERRLGMDFINGHVNLLVRHAYQLPMDGGSVGVDNFVIDFEPQLGSHRFGKRLTEDDILARYYNNRAVYYLAERDSTRAYAYFRAAIAVAPAYAPAYGNLAQLYKSKGFPQGAEQLLRHALVLDDSSYAPLRGLQKLLAAQGRTAEAQHYADLLVRHQNADPYYWLALGKSHLDKNQYGMAVRALERAASLSSGFEEIHFYLALAYWRGEQHDAARQQLALLSGINQHSAGAASLSKKFSAHSRPVSTGTDAVH